MTKEAEARVSQKLLVRIDIPVSETFDAKLSALAAFTGKPKALLARELLTVQVEGMLALMDSSIAYPLMRRRWEE